MPFALGDIFAVTYYKGLKSNYIIKLYQDIEGLIGVMGGGLISELFLNIL